MTVRSMLDLAALAMEEALAERVPEEIDVIYDIATVMVPDFCEEGHVHGVKPMVRLGLYVDFSTEKVERKAVSSQVLIPHWFVSDGDPDPVRDAAIHLWEDAMFHSILEPMAPALVKVAQEEGAYEEDLYEPDEDDDA